MYSLGSYARGLLFTFLAMVFFSAVGWIKLAEAFEGSKALLPLLMALIVWTALYFSSHYVWGILAVVGTLTYGIGLFVGLWGLGYLLLSLVVYFMPIGWVSFTENHLSQFVVGCTIASIPLLDSKFWKKVGEFTNRL